MNMNEDSYKDDLFESFSDFGSYCRCLERHRNTQRNIIIDTSEMKVLTGDDLEVLTTLPEYLIEDTQKNTSLYIMAEGEIIPVRACASYGLDNMLGVKGSFLTRLPVWAHANLLNDYAITYSEKKDRLRLFIEDDKISGVLGGNPGEFSEIPAKDVFDFVADYLAENFPRAEFLNGEFSHEYTIGRWSLAAHEEDFHDALHGMNFKPEFQVSTSDCGLASITVRPYLKGSVRIPVSPLRVKHAGNNGLSKVTEALNKVYSLIEKGVCSLEHMEGIRIDHPVTTMKRVCRACKIPKRAALEQAEEFAVIFEGGTCTARDIFESICETLMKIPANATQEQRFRYEDDVARVAGVNWHEYDLPGEFNW